MISISTMGNTDLTPTNYNTSQDSEIYYITKTDCDDYNYESIEEDLEWMKVGWFNPRKINIPKIFHKHNININIRNKLPIKFRYD